MTKKKTLLQEGTVRQFMKLANLKPLASDFVEALYEKKQGYDDRLDDTLGAKDGAEKDKKQSLKDRRKESEGEEKAHGKGADSSDKEMSEGTYGGNKGDDSRSKKDYMEEEAPYGGNKGDDSRSKKDYLQEDDKEDDDWGGNKGDESETDPGHTDYEGAPEEGGDLDVEALVRAIADAVEAHTGVSVDVADDGGDAGELEVDDEEEIDLGDGEEELELGAEDDLEEVISTIAENVTKRLQRMASKKVKRK